jgi:thioesterase domain-containing protein/acyl carrier protein
MCHSNYWVSQIREPVNFVDCVNSIASQGLEHVIEVGPGRSIAFMFNSNKNFEPKILSTLDSVEGGEELSFLTCLQRIWNLNHHINFEELYLDREESNIDELLPTYKFDKHYLWLGCNKSMGSQGTTLDEPKKNSKLVIENKECKISKIWCEVLGVKEAINTDNFFELGGDSLSALQFTKKYFEVFKEKITIDTVLNARNFQEMQNFVLAKNLPSSNCITILKQGDANLPLVVLFHPVGGEVFIYRDLVDLLDIPNEIIGVKLPRMLLDNKDISSVESLVEYYQEEIDKTFRQKEYIFVGMSFGGLLALQASISLKEKNHKKVKLLSMIDTPKMSNISKRLEKQEDVINYWLELEGKERITGLASDHDLIQSWRKTNIGMSMLKTEDVDFMKNFLDLYISLSELGRKYSPSVKNLDVLFFSANERDSVMPYKAELDWETDLVLNIIQVNGNHISMMAPPNVDKIAARLTCEITNKVNREVETIS